MSTVTRNLVISDIIRRPGPSLQTSEILDRDNLRGGFIWEDSVGGLENQLQQEYAEH